MHRTDLAKAETIEKRIFHVRGQRIMLDIHLAELYGVETKVLIQAVKRNIQRFPAEFMFQLNREEFERLRSHFVTSKGGCELCRGIPIIPARTTDPSATFVRSGQPASRSGGRATIP